jgi:hypothetical protein
MMRMGSLALVLALAATPPAVAVDHPMVGLKLIVVDKVAASGTAKVVFVTKDAAVMKGMATDPTQIEATLSHAYDTAWEGSRCRRARLVGEHGTVAKYANMDAPSGGTVRKSIIKAQKFASVVAKSLGDVPLDISAAPTGSVFVVHSVTNGEETHRHCTMFSGCVHKAIAGGTGSILVCKGNSMGDPACTAVPCGFVDQGLTVLDTCTNLEWERKRRADAHQIWCGGSPPTPRQWTTATLGRRCTNGTNVPPAERRRSGGVRRRRRDVPECAVGRLVMSTVGGGSVSTVGLHQPAERGRLCRAAIGVWRRARAPGCFRRGGPPSSSRSWTRPRVRVAAAAH